MAYDRTRWKDHVTERPRTYVETPNADGSVTLTPAMGNVLQQGTPQSATNFNKMEDGIQHTSVALDWMQCITQATLRAQNDRIEELENALAALTGA